MISLRQLFTAMQSANKGLLPLDPDQQQALQHPYTLPLWILAGPGTGKTHTLVYLTLKRVLVDGIPPERIFLTTFTRKAAAELESRLLLATQELVAAGLAEAKAVDITQMYIGTLHALATQVLQDNRYERTLRIQLLADDLFQQFFLRKTRNPLLENVDLNFWQYFDMHKTNRKTGTTFIPNRPGRAEAAAKLFNRLTENRIGPAQLMASSEVHLVSLGLAYEEYQAKLQELHYTDQAHLQAHFLEFLDTPAGKNWLGTDFAVIVDEYQDTNPIQEQIYFRLTGGRPDLTVVGDDDQSLYRFRGAMVESLVNFDVACRHYLGVDPTPARIFLRENRRSHPRIVKFVNRFIGNHPEMQDPVVRVRAPSKPALVARSGLAGTYPAVVGIAENTDVAAARKVADLIQGLKDRNLIEDYSQVAILTFSTKEVDWGIGDYTTALENRGIPIYNPRSSKAHIDQSFLGLLGALSKIVDPDGRFNRLSALTNYSSLKTYIRRARSAFEQMISSGKYPELEQYVHVSIEAIGTANYDPQKTFNYLQRAEGRRVTYSELLYKLLAHEPFATHLHEVDANSRMKVLNHIMVAFETLFEDGQLALEYSAGNEVRIAERSLYGFYGVLVEGVHDGVNDPEDQEESLKVGAVNVMTIHQSKGLQFEVVIVLRPEKQPWPSDTHTLEDRLEPFVNRPTGSARRPRVLRAAEDAIRLFFVAYSRPKRLLVVAGALTPQTAPDWDRTLGFAQMSGNIRTPRDLQEKLEMYLL